MEADQATTSSRTLSIVNFILGIWLVISPYLLSYDTAQAKWQQTVAGILIAVFAAIHYFAPAARWTSWLNAIVALWLIIAPFATGYQATAAFWNEIISAIIVGVLALSNASVDTSGMHHRGHAV